MPAELADELVSLVEVFDARDGWFDTWESQVALVAGDALDALKTLPSDSIDMAMTSPPYWNQRQYDGGGIGLEATSHEYLDRLLEVFAEVKRVLTPSGSFWLNVGDSYAKKSLVGIPWRLAIAMLDDQGWILRNDVVWSKLKGGGAVRDRLRSTHEMLFHFTKKPQYYFDSSAIRNKPRAAKVVNGSVVSATGVSGVRYRRRIELSTDLSEPEKHRAMQTLDEMLAQVASGDLADFRMVIRGSGQRTTHSDQASVSGRAKQLRDEGFYFLKYHPDGAMPSDVWEIVPEDTQKRDASHYAAYPLELCMMPIAATCPPGGVVLDPFVGTGTTALAALQQGRRAIGIDLAVNYIDLARERIARG